MIESKKRWFIQEADESVVDGLIKRHGLDPIIARLLAIRGIKEKQEIERFLNHDLSMLYDPFLFLDMKKAVDRVHTAILKHEKILIYGDYDADGVTSTTVMYKILKQLDANFDYYIPNRFTEGYGLNKEAIIEAAKQGFRVIITVDTGISAIEEANLAKELGLDLIITDHHEPSAILPNAFAILNPKTPGERYPFKLLAGVGVAFKLAHALLGRIPFEVIDIAAIGTIGDLVALVDENRMIAKAGVEQLSVTKHIGLQALIEESGLKDKKISAGHVGFTIVPRINASGRLETADHAVRLFITEDPEEAEELAGNLGSINQERQAIVEVISKEALAIVEEQNMVEDRVLVIANENWNVGVVGIVASRILEKYYRPTIILSIDPDTRMAKGSARSIHGYDIFQALTENKEILPHFGGHPAAAGLSIREEDIPQLRLKLNQLADEWLNEEDFLPLEKVDMVCSLNQITIPLIEQIERMEPFGMGNPNPKWVIEHAEVSNLTTMGKEKQHLKMSVAHEDKTIEALAFKMGHLNKEIATTSYIQLLGELNINEWNGKKKPQILIRDFRIQDLQVFDMRNPLDQSVILKDLDHENALVLFDEELEKGTLNVLQSKKVSYQQWKSSDFREMKQMILFHLPRALSEIEELMAQVPKLEKLYCIYENSTYTKKSYDPAPTRETFKQVYAYLRKYQEMKNIEKAERFFKNLGISSETFHFILAVFHDLGFIIVDGDFLSVHPNPEKKDLMESLSYRTYMEDGQVKEIFLLSNTKTLRNWFLNKFKRN